MGSLSVCVVANSTGPFLQAALSPLREIADEVVIAAGGPVAGADLECYGEVADRLYTIEFEFIERHLAWLHAQCRGDWILRLDGDEVPSPEMLDVVKAAKDDRLLSCVLFARRHTFPTPDTYIAQEPWYPDFQVRMVRNDGTMRFAGLLHTSAERTLPAKLAESPLYHLALLARPADRDRRAQRYEGLRPGLVAPTGLRIADALTPESLPTLETAPVPDAHRELLEHVLSGHQIGQPRQQPRAEAVSVDLGEMDVWWAGRSFPESAYRATIETIGAPVALAPGELRPFYFRVRNHGSETWGWDPSVGPYVHLVYRWTDERQRPIEGWRPAFFTEWVRPGTETVVPTQIQAPDRPGRFTLESRIRHSPRERVFGTAQNLELHVRPGGAWGE